MNNGRLFGFFYHKCLNTEHSETMLLFPLVVSSYDIDLVLKYPNLSTRRVYVFLFDFSIHKVVFMCWSYGPISFDQEPHLKFWLYGSTINRVNWIDQSKVIFVEKWLPHIIIWCKMSFVHLLIRQSVNEKIICVIISVLHFLLENNCIWNLVFLLV